MKNIVVRVLLFMAMILVLILSIYIDNGNLKTKNNSNEVFQKSEVIVKEETRERIKDNAEFLLFESEVDIKNGINSKVTINGYCEEPISLKEQETIILYGFLDGEFIEFIVEGEIKDFEYVELNWDEEKSDLVEKRVINRFDKLINQRIVIKTYMPEGIPSEKIRWESVTGKIYEFIIAEYNLKGE